MQYTELKRLAESATAGPFRHNKDNDQVGDVSNEAGYPFVQVQQQKPMDAVQREADAAYIAAALNAVPLLLAQNAALLEALKDLDNARVSVPSCQAGLVTRCICIKCTTERACAAIKLAEGKDV